MWKLSSNENPAAAHPAVLSAIAAAAHSVNRYPDMAVRDLVDHVSGLLEVAPEQVVFGNGSVAVLEHVLQAYCEAGDDVVYAWRSFEAYPICVQVSGARSVRVPLAAGARHDIPGMVAAVTPRTRAIIVCSPNNPTGPAVTEAELRTLLDAVPRTVLVILDEAYREYVRSDDGVDGLALLGDYPNLLTLRTFSKAYGLAGLRVGYAVGHPDVVAAVRATVTPFGVNSVAQRAAHAALGVREALLETVDATVRERERVLAAIRAAGWDVPDAHGNFFWLTLGEDTTRFVADAYAAGLVVRGFAGEGVRVSVGEPEANDAVIALLRSWRRTPPD